MSLPLVQVGILGFRPLKVKHDEPCDEVPWVLHPLADQKLAEALSSEEPYIVVGVSQKPH